MIDERDDAMVRAAVRAAVEADAGTPPSESVVAIMRATALTRAEADRHRMQREALSRAPDLGAVGLGVLRVLLALA